MSTLSRKQQTQKRHKRLRRNLSGTESRPRLAVFRSNNHIYAQIIDDDAQNTICAASTLDKDLKGSLKANAGSCDASQRSESLLQRKLYQKALNKLSLIGVETSIMAGLKL